MAKNADIEVQTLHAPLWPGKARFMLLRDMWRYDALRVAIAVSGPSGEYPPKQHLVTGLEVVEAEAAERSGMQPLELLIDNGEAQKLAEELLNNGARPASFVASQGEAAALKAHIVDLQKQNADLLEVIRFMFGAEAAYRANIKARGGTP